MLFMATEHKHLTGPFMSQDNWPQTSFDFSLIQLKIFKQTDNPQDLTCLLIHWLIGSCLSKLTTNKEISQIQSLLYKIFFIQAYQINFILPKDICPKFPVCAISQILYLQSSLLTVALAFC